ncbi:hypothetical protein [Chitinimonas koreensis]|uniref:hypothetical protein n=1 Tax=Chitinimonas koreensis TaxID=356302 RepID=UPI000423495A|nr:hypothetical protein [Chitinimonas koreensis]QNM95212.1 hypothetical protein H9L41_15175 [Chitinimonas koreensis]
MQDKRGKLLDAPFDYLACKNGSVQLRQHGRVVKTLSGREAARFLARAAGLDAAALQLLLARETGQFKFGNEKAHALARR